MNEAVVYAMAVVVALVLFYTAHITGKLIDKVGGSVDKEEKLNQPVRSNRNEK